MINMMNIFNTRNLLMILLASGILFSCVANRKITLLQGPDHAEDPTVSANKSYVRTYETVSSHYLLQSDDLLDIKISTMTPEEFNPFHDADRTLIPGAGYGQSGMYIQPQGYNIDPDGFLELPILGRIHVEGLTINQAEDSISVVVQKYLERPVVRIKLVNFRFSLLGEVEQEGTLNAGDNNLTLLQALAMAGGATEFGDLSRVKVIRHTDNHTNVFYVNLLTEEYLKSPFYYIQPNDIILIPPLKQRPYLRYISPNLSIFATAVSLLVAVFTLFQIK